MDKLVEYNLVFLKSTRSLWFYCKGEATNISKNIENSDNFKSFTYKAKLLQTTASQRNPNKANGIIKNTKIPMPLKYLSYL